MRRFLAFAGLALGLAAATAALAENATAPLLSGDRLHGNILAPGDSDALEIYIPAGSVVSADLAPERGSDLVPVLGVEPPAGGGALDLSAWEKPGRGGVGVKIRKAPLPDQDGIYVFRVTAAEGTQGKYSLRVMVKSDPALDIPEVPAPVSPGEGVVAFGAVGGSRITFTLTPLAANTEDVVVTSFQGPGGPVDFGGGLKAKKVLLPDSGIYRLRLQSAGEEGQSAALKATVKAPRPSRRDLYLSPTGFGEAPRVLSVEPSRVLDDRPATGIVVVGEGFDPAASVLMEKKGQEPLAPTSLEIVDDATIHADFDVTAVRTGAWNLVVTNPSGGAGRRRITVQAAGKVKLPSGVVPGTEVWWLDFDEKDFRTDLSLMGLGSSNAPTVSALAENAVLSYSVYFARRAFGLSGATGKADEDDVPVSFILEKPPATVGSPGLGYNRIRIGGQAAGGAPSSNPNYPWGDGPLDAANAAYDDIGPDGGEGRGIKTRVLTPSVSTGTAGWVNTFAPLQAQPLTEADLIYFRSTFVPVDAAQGTRYRDIANAVRAAGKEIGGTIAHFVARAMGTADSGTGLSAVPVLVGTYAAENNFGFTSGERAAMTAARQDGIPGTAKTLRASALPYNETRAYLLPNATTTKAYSEAFSIAGGRPDRTGADLDFLGVAGVIPFGFTLSATGSVSGTAPLYDPSQPSAQVLYGGAFRFIVRMRDTATGETILFAHRINLLVDAGNPALSPAQAALAVQKNQQTLNEP